MNFSVTQNGKEIDKSKYIWDESTRTFSTNEQFLTLDFSNLDNVTFKTRSICTFNTRSHCIFNTGSNCLFNTGHSCTFNTGSHCTFNTGWTCTFNTGWTCTFKTLWSCIFDVGEKCSLTYTWNNCFEVHKLEPNQLVKILLKGNLETIKEIDIFEVEENEGYILLQSKDNKFLYLNEENKYKELISSFKENNQTSLFMLNDNSKFANNLIKIFKFKG